MRRRRQRARRGDSLASRYAALADPSDLASALASALRFQGRKQVHTADEIMAEIVAKRLVEHLERAGFVIVKRPPEVGAAALGARVRERFNRDLVWPLCANGLNRSRGRGGERAEEVYG